MTPQPTQSAYVVCPDTITSPAPSAGAEAIGLKANMPCGHHCTVLHPAEIMWLTCPRGHVFLATPEDIRHD